MTDTTMFSWGIITIRTCRLMLVCVWLGLSQPHTVLAQDGGSTWRVSTQVDFEEGTSEGVTILSDRGGAVRILVPIVNVVPDQPYSHVLTKDYDFMGSRNTAGTLVQVFTDRDWVYGRILDANDNILVDSLKANDERCGRNTRCYHYYGSAAIMDDGSFILTWLIQIDGIGYRTRAQVFSADFQKKGSNIESFSYSSNQTSTSPRAFAMNDSLQFWVLYSVGNSSAGVRLTVNRFDRLGNPVGTASVLNPDQSASRESRADLDQLTDGSLIVSWIQSSGNSSNSTDIYVRRFSRNLEPHTPPLRVNDDSEQVVQGQVAVQVGPDQTYLLAWFDARLPQNQYAPYWYAIFGQFFDASGWRIGPNVQLSAGTQQTLHYPDIELDDSNFDVSWTSWNATDRKYYSRHSIWQLDPAYEGTYVSAPHDTGGNQTEYLGIDCDAETSRVSVIRFQIRSGHTQAELETLSWRAPRSGVEGAADPCIVGLQLHPMFNGDRYIQFKARLVTADFTRSPILKEVSVKYDADAMAEPVTRAETIPLRVVFSQPWPNPATETVKLEFIVPFTTHAQLEIFDLLGHRVAVLFSGVAVPDTHRFDWRCRGHAAGVYYARLRAGDEVLLRKLVIY